MPAAFILNSVLNICTASFCTTWYYPFVMTHPRLPVSVQCPPCDCMRPSPMNCPRRSLSKRPMWVKGRGGWSFEGPEILPTVHLIPIPLNVFERNLVDLAVRWERIHSGLVCLFAGRKRLSDWVCASWVVIKQRGVAIITGRVNDLEPQSGATRRHILSAQATVTFPRKCVPIEGVLFNNGAILRSDRHAVLELLIGRGLKRRRNGQVCLRIATNLTVAQEVSFGRKGERCC